MSFLLKSAIVIALVYFALHKEEIIGALTSTRAKTEQAAGGRRAVGGAEDALTALQRAAAAKLAGAAREHCLANPRDCLSTLKAVSAESSKREAGEK